MTPDELLKSRIKQLNHGSEAGSCVLYVMSRDQRVDDNHALLAAQKHALAKGLPLAVLFCLLENSGYRAREHYTFMLEGLKQVESELKKRNIPFMMLLGDPLERISAVCYHTKPDAVYFDFSPLRGPRKLQDALASAVDCHVFVVDTHNVVPIWVTSEKYEVGAYTIRPKIHKKISAYLVEPERIIAHPYAWPGPVIEMNKLKDKIDEVVEKLKSNGTKVLFKNGSTYALERLESFVTNSLERYALDRNNPTLDGQSGFSPYLHFGQISSLRIALRLQEESLRGGEDLHIISSPKLPKLEGAETTKQDGIDSLIEEMIVRKELADNYCYYQPNYDSIEAAPKWARDSLDAHRDDPREYVYTYEQLRDAQTHDEAWNAAQRQLTCSGKMHGYMRMYWAKKVLEWTKSPEQAIQCLIRLNDLYSIDGGDPNGYAGILWSVAGVHDRPWFERSIFGVIRYMNYAGLKKKFNLDLYLS